MIVTKNEIIINYSWKHIIHVLLCGGFLLFLSLQNSYPSIIIFQILRYFIGALGLATIVITILSIFHFKSQIIINEKGLFDKRLQNDFILWNEIKSINIIKKKLEVSFKKEPDYSKFRYFIGKHLKKANPNNVTIKIDLSKGEVDYSVLEHFLNKNMQ